MTEQLESSQQYELNSNKPNPLESVILNKGLISELTTTLNLDENQQQTLQNIYDRENERLSNKYADFDLENPEFKEPTAEEIHFVAEGDLQYEEDLWKTRFLLQYVEYKLEEKKKNIEEQKHTTPIRKFFKIFQFGK